MNQNQKTNLLYWTVWLLAAACLIFVLREIGFIFTPAGAFVSLLLVPIVAAGFLYYIFNPLVLLLEKHFHLARIWGILLVFVILFGLAAVTVMTVIPNLIRQLTDLLENLPFLIQYFNSLYQEAQELEWVQALDIERQLAEISVDLQTALTGFLTGLTGSIGVILSAVMNTAMLTLLVPLILFYMLKDGHKFSQAVANFIPQRYKDDTIEVMGEMNDTIAKYISGQAVVCLFVGTFTVIGYLAVRMPYAFLLGVISGFTNIIPYLGPYLGLIPAAFIALTISPLKLALVCVVVLVVQQIESNFVTPNILGKTLSIHPITILFLLLTAGKLAGVLGMILAVPVYAVIRTVVLYIHNFLQKQKLKKAAEGNL